MQGQAELLDLGMAQHIAIFGATSAIAGDVARLYAAQGHKLYLVGRNPEKMSQLASELGTHVVGCLVQDFDRTDEAASCVARVIAGLGMIDVALIAHGLLGDQEGSERDVSVAEQIARTNYMSVVALAMPLANYFEGRRGGHLAVLSSVAAERGRPRNYTYASAKAALNVYLQGVRSRLHEAGVSVHTIKLGPVDTPMTASHKKNLLFARAPDVAQQIVRTIERDVAEAYVPSRWRPIMFVVRHLPEGLFQRISALSGR
jgi:short-subunit dehydrogenase